MPAARTSRSCVWILCIAVLLPATCFALNLWHDVALIWPHKTPLHMGDVVRTLARCAFAAVEAAIYGSLLFGGFGELRRWIRTIRLVGVPGRTILKSNLALAKQTRFAALTRPSAWIWIAFALGGLLWFLVGIRGILLAFAMEVLGRFFTYNGLLRPPITLLLAATGERSLALHRKVCAHLPFFRHVSLLNEPDAPVSAHNFSVPVYDCLRTASGDDWHKAVAVLARTAPLVVLDCRATTDSLLDEGRMLASAELQYKTIFLTEPGGKAPLLEDLVNLGCVEEPDRVLHVPEEMLLPVLTHVLGSRKNLPSPQRTVKQICAPVLMAGALMSLGGFLGGIGRRGRR